MNNMGKRDSGPSVAHCLGSDFRGSFSPFIANQMRNPERFQPVVFSFTPEFVADMAEGSVEVPVYVPYAQSFWAKTWNRATRRVLKCPWMFRQAIRRHRVTLLHAHFGPSAIPFLPIAQKLRLPLVTSFYGYDMSSLPSNQPWYREKLQQLFQIGSLFLLEGENAGRTLLTLGCPPDKTMVNHLGVDLNRFPFSERNVARGMEIRLLVCSRLVEKKGIPYALDALHKLLPAHPRLRLTIIGDGPLRPLIVARIEELGLGQHVRLVASIPYSQYLEELYRHHILLVPSVTAQDGDTEGGAPTILLEAQASGMPVLATYHADIPEYLVDEESGFLVPERDSDALAERLAYLIDHPKGWGVLGRRGREHVALNYNMNIQNARLEDLYQELVYKTGSISSRSAKSTRVEG